MCRLFFLLISSLSLVLGSAPIAAEQIVISEIMYHPARRQPAWIEVYNNTVTPFDIANWKLSAGAMQYEFPSFSPNNPQLTFLKPFERIVLSSTNVETLQTVWKIPPSVRIYGPWTGRLKNSGDHIVLQDKNGVVVCAVTYNDRGKWPPAADGAGHSLVLKDPNKSVGDWRNWTASTLPGGTPGMEPTSDAGTPVANPETNANPRTVLVNYSDSWRYFDRRGDLGSNWRNPNFDDGTWPEGPGLLGFEDAPLPPPGIRTPVNFGNQTTYYFRGRFFWDGDPNNVFLTLDQVLDDGAIYYLNGKEIGRSRMPAGPIGFNTFAAQNIADAIEEFNVFPINNKSLQPGTNILAVEVHQSAARSTDMVFGARLSAYPLVPSTVVINKVFPGPAGRGYVEFFNSSTEAINVRGYFLSNTHTDLRSFQISTALIVPPKGVASIGFAESGLDTGGNALGIYLTAPDGKTVIHALAAPMPADGLSLGRKPAGSRSWYLLTESGRGSSNDNPAAFVGIFRLNEIHFSGNDVDWVELYNTRANPVATDGLFLSARRDFSDRVPLTGVAQGKNFVTRDVSFALKSGEVTIYLLNAANTVLDCHVFARPARRDTLQSFPDGGKDWYAAASSTRGAANNPEHNRDIIINEIMYDPPHGQKEGQFVELFNRGKFSVDLSGWRFVDGVDFTFPANATLAAGGYLVVAANTNWMLKSHGDIPVTGNFKGNLSNRGELIRLVDQWGNLVNEVDYRTGGDWPVLAKGGGSSMELLHPSMDNRLSSAWADSDESNKSKTKKYSCVGMYQQLTSLGSPTDYKEVHLHMVGNGHLLLQNIALRKDGAGPNLIANGASQSRDGSSASGWLIQGNHAASYVTNGQFHLISEGHGDNRPNRAEIDATGLNRNEVYQLSVDARWISGSPRLIAQTWDHSVAGSFLIQVPNNLGTPGAPNSRLRPNPVPQIDQLRHSPAVPKSQEPVKITAKVFSAAPLVAVHVFHRLDTANGKSAWARKQMFDDGVNGGDAVAGDGVFTAEFTEYKSAGAIVQFYVRSEAQNGEAQILPRRGTEAPAMYVVDDRTLPRDLRTSRFIVSAHDLDAIANGNTPQHSFRYPRLSNHYFNMTFISNEEEIFYGAEIRTSGSPWTRRGSLDRGKWKLPEDRPFRNHTKFMFDNDASGSARHYNRFARYVLYLMGHPANENEFIRVVLNNGGVTVREDTEPVDADFLNRVFPHGNKGDLYRIDDEWWFTDDWQHNNRDADWSYKGSNNAGRYRTEWMKRSNEVEDDFTALINFFKTVSSGNYTQSQIEQLIDPHATLKMAVVRGYIGDWDTFSLFRGKNAYFYRRPTDGRFQFFHWDSDLAFRDVNSVFYNGASQFRSWLEQPYNKRIFYGYLAELIENYAKNSARMDAWMHAEETAHPACRINSMQFRSWFEAREGAALRALGRNYKLNFAITTNGGKPITTASGTISLTGIAPYGVMQLAVADQPEIETKWLSETAWAISNVRLRDGENFITVNGTDQWGKVLRSAKIAVTKNGRAGAQ